MKKLLGLCIISLLSLCGCNQNSSTQGKLESKDNSESSSSTQAENDKFTNINNYWDDSYATDITKNNIVAMKYNVNNRYEKEDFKFTERKNDIKYEFYTQNQIRFVNASDEYAITINDVNASFDYSISKYRTQITFGDSILSASYEYSNPYGDSTIGWNRYLTEWLNRYIANPKYLEDNNLTYSRECTTNTTMLPGYEILFYSIVINDNEQISHPYYNIAIVRQSKSYTKFNLFVMKSKTNCSDKFDNIIKSFKNINKIGETNIHMEPLERKINPNWSEETKRYYDLISDEKTFQWGFFSYSMPADYETTYDQQLQRITDEEARLQTMLNYTNDIIPTYTHLSWQGTTINFPNKMAQVFAKGNGFNGKKVLQFTLQYTNNNNNVSSFNKDNNYTPSFDVLRGKYDEYFRNLAKDVKAYEQPILFRLNNEMNTDWTSYSGIMSLIDPDIFRASWRRLYDIFEEEKVSNCIWIFNPMAQSCPYSSWGEDLCYFPGNDYVNALGLTYYEMGNGEKLLDFNLCFNGNLYNKNKKVWKNLPWVIPEFGCGSGGNSEGLTLYRNQEQQAKWVTDLFNVVSAKEKYDFFKKVSVAVWFNYHDYNQERKIVNALKIDDEVTSTINAFKEGLAKIKKS